MSSFGLEQIAKGLTQQINNQPELTLLSRSLFNKSFAWSFPKINKVFYLSFIEGGEVILSESFTNDITTEITINNIFDLIPFSPNKILDLIKTDKVNVTGDLTSLNQVVLLAQGLNFDIEGIVANYIGDIPAHSIFKIAASIKDKIQPDPEVITQMLTVDNKIAVHKVEFLHWQNEISKLEQDVNSLSLRISNLAQHKEHSKK